MGVDGRKFRFKITVIGDGRVGKTSLIKRFTQGSFKKDYVKTIGAQFSVFDKQIGDDKVRLIFWDIAGQDQFHFLRPSFFNNSKGAIIVYSLEDNKAGLESFKHISTWDEDIRKFCGDIPVILFGNKVDLVNESTLDDSVIQGVVKKNDYLGYYRTSAETGKGVITAFDTLIEELYRKFKGLSDELGD